MIGNIKNTDNFKCLICNYKCSKQSDWNRHISRPKHINGNQKTPNKEFVCLCGNTYKHHSGLIRHKKICLLPLTSNNVLTNINNNALTSNNVLTNINNNALFDLIKQNEEFKKC